jgi:hypothetical protein
MMSARLPSFGPISRCGTSRNRDGFGLLAIIMFVAIIATLLALSIPALLRYNQVSRVRRTWQILDQIKMATSQITPAPAATYPVFRQRVGNNPGRLSQLVGPINSGDATNYPDACGTTFKNSERDDSRLWGPFLSRGVTIGVGLATPMGVANDDLIRSQLGGNWYLIVTITQADLSDIVMLDQYDNNDGAAAGLIRWDNVAGSTARLLYLILSDNAC